MKIITLVCIGLLFISCTENNRARNWGGTETYQLKPNEVFVNMTWKETSLWILTKDTVTNSYYFREDSPYGVMEGQVIVK